MNLQAKLRTLLAVVALAAVGASSFAADPPEGSPSVVASAIRLRDKLPPTAPPLATDIVVKEGALELTTQAMVAEQRMVRERVATSDGRVVEVERVITAYRSVPVQQRVDAKSVKVFQVTKDGTLKAHDTKPAELFAKATAVLCGASETVDPRHLELVKPGTIYVMIPPQRPEEIAPPPERDKER